MSQYGGGYQQLVEIAKALNKKARLLILDEPSSALTRSEIEVLLDIIRDLKAKGVACVYISHKLDEVAAVCDTISVIRDGKHIATTAMADMDIPQIITQMVGREMSNLYPTEPHEIGEVIFEARHITCYDVDNPKRKRVDDISFVLKRGEILGIAGLVGAGRTELVSALFGAYPGRYERRSVARRPSHRHAHAAQIDPRRAVHGARGPQAPRHHSRPGRGPEHHPGRARQLCAN